MSYATTLTDHYYGNDKNPYDGRYQALHTYWNTSATDVTGVTPNTTEIIFNPFGVPGELLDILVKYGAASGTLTTAAACTVHKYIVGSGSPTAIATGLTVLTESSQPVRTIREWSCATLASGAVTTGSNAVSFPQIALGEQVRLLFTVAGVGGTQTAVTFGIRWRERPVQPVGPTVATAGNVSDKSWP